MFDRKVSIVDTPGLFDTSLPEHKVKREISKCINMSAPGPHAILLVIKVGPFTNEEQDAVKQVEEIFGEDAWRYTMILFTQEDEADVDVKEAGPELQKVLRRVQNRHLVLNNHRADDRSQVLELLEKMEQMVAENGGEFYTNPTYLQVMEMLRSRESELRAFYQRKLEERVKALEQKYEEMLGAAGSEPGALKRKRQRETDEVHRFYGALMKDARHVVEQFTQQDSKDKIYQFHMTLKMKSTS